MSLVKLNDALYRWKGLLSAILWFTIAYFVAFSWVFIPPLGLFMGWHPDTQLVVLPKIEAQYQQFVQPGDRVLSIDGIPALRGNALFPYPVKSDYELSLQRGEEIVIETVVVGESELFRVWEMSKAILATLIWLVGFLTARYARPDQPQAVIVGLSFQLIAAGIVSPGPTQLGAPGAWLVGQVLIFYFPLIMLYLSFIPRYTPWNQGTRLVLKGSFVLLTGLALVAAGEQLFLYPETSLGDLVGIRSLTILTVLTGISLVATVAILIVRMIRSPRNSYERQQLAILSLFLLLAVAPLFLFVILPLDQTVIFAPFPFIYSFFLLAPLGYFFVFHRQGYLQLDVVFSQFITVVILVLAVVMAYATGVYLFETVFLANMSQIAQGILVLALFGLAIVGQRPVQGYVEILLYGRDLPGAESLQDARAKLATNPQPVTVTEVVAQVANRLQVQETAVLAKTGEHFYWMAGNAPPFMVASSVARENIGLRSREARNLSGFPDWVELSLPILARGEVLGFFLLSRPANGYFNAGQVRLLQEIADILAFSLLVINLVEAMQTLSHRSLYERELQRQQLATEIHNAPLHTLTTLMMQLRAEQSEKKVEDTAQVIRQVTRDLRRIIAGLRPIVLKEAIDWMARQMVRDFDQNNSGLTVNLHLEIETERPAPEQIKTAFYYVLTEALNNVTRHAQANQVDVRMRYDEEELLVTVADDGVGPGDAIHPLPHLLRHQHHGVVDMHRWASGAGGSLAVSKNMVGGTSVTLRLPLSISDTPDLDRLVIV
jgi:signal transduction histidine kinase